MDESVSAVDEIITDPACDQGPFLTACSILAVFKRHPDGFDEGQQFTRPGNHGWRYTAFLPRRESQHSRLGGHKCLQSRLCRASHSRLAESHRLEQLPAPSSLCSSMPAKCSIAALSRNLLVLPNLLQTGREPPLASRYPHGKHDIGTCITCIMLPVTFHRVHCSLPDLEAKLRRRCLIFLSSPDLCLSSAYDHARTTTTSKLSNWRSMI